MNKLEKIHGTISLLKRTLRKKAASGNIVCAPKFVFVCGQELPSNNGPLPSNTVRSITRKNLEKGTVENAYGSKKKSVMCIISEYLFEQELADDIFSFEAMLAEISDKIIVPAESAGTFCELGSFVMDKNILQKLIVINEDKEEYKKSFVSKGPIKYMEQNDEKSVILYNSIERLSTTYLFNMTMKEILKMPINISPNNNKDCIKLKPLIYELANLIEILQPIDCYELQDVYKLIKGFENYNIVRAYNNKIRSIKDVLFLMEKMELIKKHESNYYINNNISCFNVMFDISRKMFNDLRLYYLKSIDFAREG